MYWKKNLSSIRGASGCSDTRSRGTVGRYAAALDVRVQAVVSIAGLTPMRIDTSARGTGRAASYSHQRGLIPRLGFFVGREAQILYGFDLLLATIMPRPVLIVEP